MESPKPTLSDLKIERRNRPKSTIKPAHVVTAICALVLLAILVWWFLRPKAIEVHTTIAREVSTASGERTVLNASGYVTARRTSTASSKVTGKVAEVLIEEGMKVKEGQILAKLDDTNVKTSLNLAQAQLESAEKLVGEIEAQLKQAEAEFQRTTELAKLKIASQSDLDAAEANAKTLRARLERQQADVVVARRQVEAVQQQLEDLIIRAPFDGVVTTKNSQPGEMISPISAGGGFTRTGIGTIVDMDSLEIEVDVNESFINRVQAGQDVEATLDSYPQWKIPCKVIAIVPTADRQKSTVKVRVGFNKLDPRILPDMAVKVAFQENGSREGGTRLVAVPKNAVRQQNGRDVVFVVKDRKAERRAVTVSDRSGNEALVSAGVSSGDKVIVDSPEGLKDGVKVKETE